MRLLSIGDVLDESVRLYRQHWVTFALISAIALLPPGLVQVSGAATGRLRTSFTAADLQSGGATLLAAVQNQIPALGVTYALSFLFGLLYLSAIVATASAFIHRAEASAGAVYGRVLRRY